MTNEEKVKFLVDRLFGDKVPRHLWIGLICSRCGTSYDVGVQKDSQCFDPLTRIEDAFLVVDKMSRFGHWMLLGKYKDEERYSFVIETVTSRAGTIQEAIVSAAVAALEQVK